MKVKFLTDCEIEVYSHFDENQDLAESETQIFRTNDEVEFDLIDHPDKFVNGKFTTDKTLYNVQFPNGKVAFALSTEWFQVIEPNEQSVIAHGTKIIIVQRHSLVIMPDKRRGYRHLKAKCIADHFDWTLFGVPVVTTWGYKYELRDGMHRVLAMDMLFGEQADLQTFPVQVIPSWKPTKFVSNV